MTTETGRTTTRFRLSQEMIAIVTVGLALAGLNLVTIGDLRDLREEARADRAAWQAESRQYRDEARSARRGLPARDPPDQGGARQARRRRFAPTGGATVRRTASSATGTATSTRSASHRDSTM